MLNCFTKRYKKISQKALGFLLAMAMVASIVGVPSQASAAEYSANSLTELAKIVRQKTMERDNDFTVDYGGTSAEFDSLFGEDMDFFYYTMVSPELDDPATTDDADYIVGNIDFSKDFLSASGNTLHFTPSYFETSAQTQFVNQKTTEILNSLGVAAMGNYDKVKTIHDYVCSLISYYDDAENYSSVYAAYTTGYGLCNSYALCMYKLLTAAGIPCKWIGGTAGTGRDAGGHAWNIVQLGNVWYNLDATWDDTDNQLSYDYFLRGMNDFDESDSSQVHTMDKEYRNTQYLSVFPISSTKFVPGTSGETNTIPVPTPVNNTTVTPSVSVTPTQVTSYNFKNIVSKTNPSTSKTLSITKGKKKYIYIYLKNEAAADLIYNYSYKVTSGKSKIKVKKYNSIYPKGKGYYLKLAVTGKKTGKSKIKVTLSLTNGQKKSYTFKTKVKSNYYWW